MLSRSCVTQADEETIAARLASASDKARSSISEARAAVVSLGKCEEGHEGTLGCK